MRPRNMSVEEFNALVKRMKALDLALTTFARGWNMTVCALEHKLTVIQAEQILRDAVQVKR